MLDNLIQLVRDNASGLDHPAITADKKEEAITLAGTSIFDGFKSILTGGGVTSLMSFFKGGETNLLSNPVVKEVTTNFINRFTNAFKMNTQDASGLAGSFLPGIMDKLITKANDPADKTFDMQQMFDQFSGGKTSKLNIAALFNKVKSGLDKDHDGDVDFQDLKAIFTSGVETVVDKIKNVFK